MTRRSYRSIVLRAQLGCVLSLGVITAFDGAARADSPPPPPPFVVVTAVHGFANTPVNGSFAGAEGGHPRAALLEGADGKLYGTTALDGPNMSSTKPNGGCDAESDVCPGSIFRMTRAGAEFTVVHAFSARVAGSNIDGYQPRSALTQDAAGFLYGTTIGGGTPVLSDGTPQRGCGVAYKVKPDGSSFQPLHYFCSEYHWDDGAGPNGASLVHHGDGFVYGVTNSGSSNGNGVIFRVATDATPADDSETLYRFSATTSNTDGRSPNGSPIFGDGGTLWGLTVWGGATDRGTIYSFSLSDHAFATRYTFPAVPLAPLPQSDTDSTQSLIKGRDGNFYGSSQLRGANGTGVVFKMTPDGVYTTLHEFGPLVSGDASDGARPIGTLVEGPDGNLYGTTSQAGRYGNGTIYQVTKSGSTFVTLFSFPSTVFNQAGVEINSEGANPLAGMIRSVNDGYYYGTTYLGGAHGFGTVYRMMPPLMFAGKTNVPLSTLVLSDPISIAAVANGNSGPISISNGEYSLNGGAFTSAPGMAHTTDTLVIRTMSASTYGTRVLASYSIGTANGAFPVTTAAAP